MCSLNNQNQFKNFMLTLASFISRGENKKVLIVPK